METVPRPNTVIAGRYAIERELGRGGMATVYLAKDRQHDTFVAMKVLHPELAPLFAGERFAREIRITAGLQHPNVVPVLDSGLSDGLPFYTMPFVDGESLAARLAREHQLPIDEALNIAITIADALAYAHERGFVHRDIKPQNILLSRGHAVLADFGIARAMDTTGGERITESGVALGTAMYMSPEQGSGGKVDGRSDIYALGCVVYEMLAGAPPFTGPTPQAVLARHSLDPVPPIQTVRQTVGPRLDRVLQRALAKVPADRFSSAAELKTALVEAAAEQATITKTGPIRTHAGRVEIKRSTLVAIVAVVVAVAGIFIWRSRVTNAPDIDASRIAVFPLDVRSAPGTSATLGEDVATVIGHTLDGTGALKWVDGWRLASGSATGGNAPLSPSAMAALARASGCGAYVTGKVIPTGTDSVAVYLEVFQSLTDSLLASGNERGLTSDAWRVGIRAINSALPKLIPGAAEADLLTGWVDRKPEVVAAFLLGESAFRRARSSEALTQYRKAISLDSTFALAAIRGAQAATWEHRASEASSLIRLALAPSPTPLTPRYAAFARGHQAYIEGRADSAAAEFKRALAIDPDMATAWIQLGETYTHLLPVSGAPDLRADSAFGEAMRRDPSATHMLLHPIESLLRRGLTADAAPLIQRFIAGKPDSTLAAQIGIMDACVRDGATKVDWKRALSENPMSVLFAAYALAVGGRQLPCAEAAYTAIRVHETAAMAAADPAIDARRWTALVGLHGVLVAQGRADEAALRVDSAFARGEGGQSLMLVAGPLAAAFEASAEKAALAYEAQWGRLCERCTSNDRLWQLGVWFTHKKDAAAVSALATALAARAQAAKSSGIALMGEATAARGILARGDTAAAIAALSAVLGTPVPSGAALIWRDAEGRGPERLALARLLFAKREYQRAIEVADVFDSPANQSYVAYLPASLALRAAAADSIQHVASRAMYRARIAALGRTPTAMR